MDKEMRVVDFNTFSQDINLYILFALKFGHLRNRCL